MSLKIKQIYEFGAFRLDAAEKLLFQNGEPLPLPPKVLDTLLVLVENSGHLIEKEELIRRVWPDTFVEENNLNKNVSMLRKALGEGQDEQKFIETVPKRGYRFVANVRQTGGGDETELIIERTKARVMIEEEHERDAPEDEPEIKQSAADAQAVALINGGDSPLAGSGRRRFLVFALFGALLIVLTGLWLVWKKPVKSSGNPPAQPPAAAAPLRTIAVLPFQPISADSRDEFLELGMADALITKLGNLEQVVVRPTSAVRKYAGLNQDPLAAGREQKVDAVLVGNVQKAGNTLRVTVQLLNVEDGRSLWSDKFDVKFTDIFTVQDAISEKVTGKLAPHITGEERARLNKRYTQDDEAYQLYQKGRYFLEVNTEDGIRQALDYFRQATEKDPNYALAYVGITESYMALDRQIGGISHEEVPQAKAAGARAIALDETLAEAHHALGDILFIYDWDWPGAELEFKRAIQLNPNDPGTRRSYGDYLLAAGRIEEGLAESKRSVELDPLSVQTNLNYAVSLIAGRRYDEALAQLRETLDLKANYANVQAMIGRVYLLQGMYEEAAAQYQKALDSGGDRRSGLVGLAQTYAHMGRRDEAQKMFEELRSQPQGQRVQSFYIAIVQTALGEKDAAFESLEKSFADHELGILYLKVEARLDSLRDDPRFAELMRRVGIPS